MDARHRSSTVLERRAGRGHTAQSLVCTLRLMDGVPLARRIPPEAGEQLNS